MRFGKQGCHAFQAFITKLGHASAHCAQEMLMMRNTPCGFIALETFAEIALDDEPTAHQDFDGTVDSRRAGVRAMRAYLLRDFFGGEMSISTEDDVGNGKTLRGYGEVVLAQIVPERIASVISCVERCGSVVGGVAHVGAMVLSGVRCEARGQSALP